MPAVEEVLLNLSNAKVFPTLNAKDGFYQIGLDEESSKLTTFWSHAIRKVSLSVHEWLVELSGVKILCDDILVVGYRDTLEETNCQHDDRSY